MATNYYPGLSAFMEALRTQESGSPGGNYTDVNRSSGAGGAYQFMPSSWSSWANTYGYGQYANMAPQTVPGAIQDAVAQDQIEAYYRQFGGNWTDVAEAWYGGPGSVGKPSTGGGPGYPDVGQYAAEVMANYAKYGGVSNNQGATGNYNPAATGISGTLNSQDMPGYLNQILQALGLSGQSTMNAQQLAFQQQVLGQNYGFSQQQFGIQGNELQMGLEGAMQAIQHENSQYGFQQQQDALTGQNITAAINNIVANFGIQSQQLNTSIAQEQLGFQQQEQGIATSGVYNTGTQRQALTGQAQQMQQFSLQREAMTTAEQYNLFQEAQAQAGLKLTESEQKEQYGYTYDQLQRGYRQIEDQIKSLGISEQQAQTQYSNALAQLGLNNVMSTVQLEQEIAAMAGGGYSPMSGMMGQIMQAVPMMSGLFTNPSSLGG